MTSNFEHKIKTREKFKDNNYMYFIQLNRDLDNYLIVAITGSIALSVNFIGKIVEYPLKETINYLMYSWIILSIALLLILFSFYHSIHKSKKVITDMDESKFNLFDYTTHLAGICLIIGLALLLTFSYKNLEARSIESKAEYNTQILFVLLSDNDGNLYEMPSRESDLINEINKGVAIEVLYRKNNWCFVQVEGEYGWLTLDEY